MKDKYYTPTKEEFYIGFEYEVLQKAPEPNSPTSLHFTFLPELTEDTWFKYKYPDPFLGYNLDKLFKVNDIRVKYLDKDDIEDLGFKHLGDNNFLLRNDNCDWSRIEMQLDEKNTNIEIGNCMSYEDYMCFFNGSIKNKSELKVLLKQLNIL